MTIVTAARIQMETLWLQSKWLHTDDALVRGYCIIDDQLGHLILSHSPCNIWVLSIHLCNINLQITVTITDSSYLENCNAREADMLAGDSCTVDNLRPNMRRVYEIRIKQIIPPLTTLYVFQSRRRICSDKNSLHYLVSGNPIFIRIW